MRSVANETVRVGDPTGQGEAVVPEDEPEADPAPAPELDPDVLPDPEPLLPPPVAEEQPSTVAVTESIDAKERMTEIARRIKTVLSPKP